jgi:hypothetical protein
VANTARICHRTQRLKGPLGQSELYLVVGSRYLVVPGRLRCSGSFRSSFRLAGWDSHPREIANTHDVLTFRHEMSVPQSVASMIFCPADGRPPSRAMELVATAPAGGVCALILLGGRLLDSLAATIILGRCALSSRLRLAGIGPGSCYTTRPKVLTEESANEPHHSFASSYLRNLICRAKNDADLQRLPA